MSWNYRVVRRTYPSGEVLYEIHEAYYHRRAGGVFTKRPAALTVDPVDPCGESVDEIRRVLARMLDACDKPVIDYDTRREVKAA